MTRTLEDRLAQMVWTMGALRLAQDPRIATTVLEQPNLDTLKAAEVSRQKANQIVQGDITNE